MAETLVAQNQLATNTLGYAQITTDFTTTSATSVQVTGLSVTVTIPTGGRRVRITGYIGAGYNGTGGSGILATIWDGTVGTGTQLAVSGQERSSTSIGAFPLIPSVIVTPSAGSKTYNIGINTANGGTAHTNSSASNISYILVELI